MGIDINTQKRTIYPIIRCFILGMPSFDLSPEVGGFRLQKTLLCIDSANILDLLQKNTE